MTRQIRAASHTLTVQQMRRLVSLVLVAMVVSVALLPPEHVHVSRDGRSYAHRHSVVVLPGRNPSLRGHEASDHSHAIFLNPSFVAQSVFAAAQPALLAVPFSLPQLERTHRDKGSAGLVWINGPPLRILSSRAPPHA